MAEQHEQQTTRDIVMLAYDNAQVLDVVGPLEVFSRTSRWLNEHQRTAQDAYRVEVVSVNPGDVTVSSGLALSVKRSYRDVTEDIDTLLVSGGIGMHAAMQDEALLAWLNGMQGMVRRLGSICTGSFLLAEASLLDGRSATTHWAYCDELEELSDKIHVDRDAVYITDGSVYTSAGVTSGMDMALGMVEEDWGPSVAMAVAKELVLYVKRQQGDRQISRHLKAQLGGAGRITELQDWILKNLDRNLSLDVLADHVSLSERSLARHFVIETGMTPAKFITRCRVEAAQRLLMDEALSMKAIAAACGFSNEVAMRRAFQRLVGLLPSEYRSSQ